MRKLLFNLHLWFALVAGVFIAILGITGSIMAFEPELEHITHPHRSYVTAGSEYKSLAELSAAAGKVAEGKPVGYSLSTAANGSWAVLFPTGSVYVNPYTAEILDVDRDTGPGVLGWIHAIHLRLATPLWMKSRDPHRMGQQIINWSGVSALFLVVSGLYLWWPTKRVRVQWKSGERKSWFDLHNAIGVVSLVFLLVLCLTGLMIGFEEQTSPLAYKLTGSQPSAQPKPQIEPHPGEPLISADHVLQAARTAFPEAKPILVMEPNPKQLVRVGMRFPEDRTPGGRTRLLIDPYTGKVAFAESSRTAPAGTRLVILNRALHTGDIFGLPSKFVMSLASFAIFAQFVSGLVMWWKRIRARKRAREREHVAVAAS